MRIRLAHQFWDIDPQILWSTVTEDFPALLSLLSTTIVIENPLDAHEDIIIEFESARFLGLPVTTPGAATEAGHSLVTIVFDPNGGVEVIRIKKASREAITTNVDPV